MRCPLRISVPTSVGYKRMAKHWPLRRSTQVPRIAALCPSVPRSCNTSQRRRPRQRIQVWWPISSLVASPLAPSPRPSPMVTSTMTPSCLKLPWMAQPACSSGVTCPRHHPPRMTPSCKKWTCGLHLQVPPLHGLAPSPRRALQIRFCQCYGWHRARSWSRARHSLIQQARFLSRMAAIQADGAEVALICHPSCSVVWPTAKQDSSPATMTMAKCSGRVPMHANCAPSPSMPMARSGPLALKLALLPCCSKSMPRTATTTRVSRLLAQMDLP